MKPEPKPDEPKPLHVIRTEQCIAAIDEFCKDVTNGCCVVPQALKDAVESLRETLPKPAKEGK